jgi:hypothetical protein
MSLSFYFISLFPHVLFVRRAVRLSMPEIQITTNAAARRQDFRCGGALRRNGSRRYKTRPSGGSCKWLVSFSGSGIELTMARIAAWNAGGSFDQDASTFANSGLDASGICAYICVHPLFGSDATN